MKNIKYDKEFKTFEEQISYLKNTYNLIIKNEDLALELLKIFPYYNLINGYKEYFMKNGKYNNTSLEDLVSIHLLDKNFLTIIFKYSTYVEDIFKHKLAYVISSQSYNHVDKDFYLKDSKLFKKNFSSNIIKTLEKILSNPNVEDPTKHYLKVHNHIPTWIFFKNVNFYEVTELFKIFNSDLKTDVIKMFYLFYKTKFKFNSPPKDYEKKAKRIEIFEKSLLTVRKFRNLISHNLKVFTYTLNKGISTSYFNDTFINNFLIYSDKKYEGDLYTCIISIILLLDAPLSTFFIKDLQLIINEHKSHSNTYFKMYRLPSNFNEILEKIYDELNHIK
ncbi:Abi family protein [Streptobacillus moniliformis]|uniref:Abi family protein n=1 Tax=Streptobacillus moniliformis TaxID=34105 RepID=UPI0007E322C2|nr:Abi family protein [Streptobacillus moniliformis]